MSRKTVFALCSVSAFALAACANKPEIASQTIPILAKDGTVIGQRVVTPGTGGKSFDGPIIDDPEASTNSMNNAGIVDPDMDGSDDSDDDDNDDS